MTTEQTIDPIVTIEPIGGGEWRQVRVDLPGCRPLYSRLHWDEVDTAAEADRVRKALDTLGGR